MALFISTKSSCSFINRISVKIWGNYNLEQWLEMWLPHSMGKKSKRLFFSCKGLISPSSEPSLFLQLTGLLVLDICACHVCPASFGAVGAPRWAARALGAGPGCPCPWLWSLQSSRVTATEGDACGLSATLAAAWPRAIWFVLALPRPWDVAILVPINRLCFLPSFCFSLLQEE